MKGALFLAAPDIVCHNLVRVSLTDSAGGFG